MANLDYQAKLTRQPNAASLRNLVESFEAPINFPESFGTIKHAVSHRDLVIAA